MGRFRAASITKIRSCLEENVQLFKASVLLGWIRVGCIGVHDENAGLSQWFVKVVFKQFSRYVERDFGYSGLLVYIYNVLLKRLQGMNFDICEVWDDVCVIGHATKR